MSVYLMSHALKTAAVKLFLVFKKMNKKSEIDNNNKLVFHSCHRDSDINDVILD